MLAVQNIRGDMVNTALIKFPGLPVQTNRVYRPRDLTPQAYNYIHILTENGKKTQF